MLPDLLAPACGRWIGTNGQGARIILGTAAISLRRVAELAKSELPCRRALSLSSLSTACPRRHSLIDSAPCHREKVRAGVVACPGICTAVAYNAREHAETLSGLPYRGCFILALACLTLRPF